jgi:hypothetical protein
MDCRRILVLSSVLLLVGSQVGLLASAASPQPSLDASDPPVVPANGGAADRPSAPPTGGDAGANNSTVNALSESDLPSASSRGGGQAGVSGRTATVVIAAANASAINTTRLRALGSDVTSRHGRHLEVAASPTAIERIEALPWVRSVTPVIRPSRDDLSSGVTSMQAAQLRDRGVRGDNVSVGVLTFGVRADAPEYADQVVATRSFHPAGLRGTDGAHGTAVTEVVADTAPGADLFLTTFDSQVDYANAISWLRERDVDVVVMSISFYGRADTGESYVSRVTENATDSGILWANSAGNTAENHWQGTYADPDGDAWLNVDGRDETNALNGGDPLSAGTTVRLHLKWQDFPETNTDYTLHLLDDDREIVASSERLPGGFSYPYESLTATLPHDGRYYLAIEGSESPHLLEVYGSDNANPLEYHTPEGSVRTPGVVAGVTTVGAYHVDTGRLAPYSSAGPTNDGRRGVDVLGPSKVPTRAYDGPFVGTSAAAPHVGGAAALLLAVNGSATGADVETALLQSADDVGPEGTDVYTGAGKVNVTASAEAIDPSVPLHLSANRSRVAVGEWVSYRVTRADTGTPVNATLTVDGRTVTTGPDGDVAVSYATGGDRTVTAESVVDPPTVDLEMATVSTSVGPRHVDLRLAANRTVVRTGGTVEFTVTANATATPLSNVPVSIGGTTRRTDERGRLTYTLTEPGTVVAATTATNTSSHRFEQDAVDLLVQNGTTPSVTAYRLDRTTLTTEQKLTVTATVANPGERARELDVTLSVDGTDRRTRTVRVAAGTSTELAFTTGFDATGTHDVTVDERSATEVVVEPPNLAIRYDADGDGYLGMREIQTAIRDWVVDGGHRPGLTDVQRLIAMWAESEPVSEF